MPEVVCPAIFALWKRRQSLGAPEEMPAEEAA